MKTTALITGATDGIGRVTARELAKKGFDLILVGRSESKLSATKEELIDFGVKVNTELADLSLVKECDSLVKRVIGNYPTLDVLVNNAGAFFQNRELTEEGFEKTFALNHISYFVMAIGLLPLLQKSKQSRIVNVASAAHFGVTLDFQNLQGEGSYSGWVQYQRSKLMNIAFTYSLAKRISGSSVSANCLHPGFVRTNFGRNNAGFLKFLLVLSQQVFAISEEEGAKTSVFLASAPEVNAFSGLYYDKCRSVNSSKVSYDTGLQENLWSATESILERARS